MIQHTPGPWYTDNGAHLTEDKTKYTGSIDVLNKPNYGIPGLQVIAAVHPYGGWAPEYPEALGNAQLMAAAPDMLKTLQYVLGGLPNDEQLTDGETRAEVAKIRAAIIQVLKPLL